MKISMDKKYTSNRNPIRILCTDRPKTVYPIVGMDQDGGIHYFKEDGTISEFSMFLTPDQHMDDYKLVEVWKPKKYEWCWFWDEEKLTDNPYENVGAHLSMFAETEDGYFKSIDGYTWRRCAKYDSEIPEFLKELEKEARR
jgi:hypothetical protein